MTHNTTNTNYTIYSLEDFLNDDFFISSIKNPTEQTLAFWKEFEGKSPSNIQVYDEAVRFIENLTEEKAQLSENEVSDIWVEINHSIHKSKKRKRLYYACSIAACVTVIAIVSPIINTLLNNNRDNSIDIVDFANQMSVDGLAIGETQLILSEDKVLEIAGENSQIAYDSTGVKVNKEDISKENIGSFNQLITPRGKRSVLTLSDGSKIWVNAGTRVIYPSIFEKNKREIYVDGEIYIEVTKDATRPFYVRTKDMNVRVLGTVFNITAYESEPSRNVVLVSGSVEVDTKKTKTKLVPNQMFYATQNQEKIATVDVERYTSWRKGLYYFDKESLEQVFKRLSVYYGVDIEYSSQVGELRCSGKLDMKDDINKVLEGLQFVAPITYRDDNGVYKVTKK